MPKNSSLPRRFLEIALILIAVGLCVLLHRTGAYRLVVLNLFYLPVVLAAFFLGRYQAGVLTVLSIILVAVVTALDLGTAVSYSSPVIVGLALTIWGAVLALTAILAGTLSDERSETMQELHEAYVGVIEVLSRYLHNADRRLNERSALSAQIAQQVAVHMRLSGKQVDDIRVAMLLHDMESVEVTSRVIRKALGNVAQSHPKQHTFYGGDLAKSLSSVLRGALPLLTVRNTAYGESQQDGLAESEVDVPIGSRVIHTVRDYVNLIADQPETLSPRRAIMLLKSDVDAEHHPAVLHALEQVVLGEDSESVMAAHEAVLATSGSPAD